MFSLLSSIGMFVVLIATVWKMKHIPFETETNECINMMITTFSTRIPHFFLFHKMQEAKFAIAVASGCSALAIITCLAVIPSMYTIMREISNEVLDEVQVCV